MNKKHIKLTESDLHKIVKESVNRVLKEETPTYSHNELVRSWDLDQHNQPDRFNVDTNYHYDDDYNVDVDDYSRMSQLAKRYMAFCAAIRDAKPQTRMGSMYLQKFIKDMRQIENDLDFVLKCERMGEGLPPRGGIPTNIVRTMKNYQKP